jgi:choline monooxygenase
MTPADYVFDRRLAHARTLPSELYFGADALRRENEQLFGRTWQLVGRADQVARPGDYFTTVVAEEPVLVVRGDDGLVRAMSNVCRHRAGPVAKAEGHCERAIQCRYHGWTYGLDGSLKGTPEFAGVEEFDRRDVRLPEFRVSEWSGLIFVNLDPAAAPLESVLTDLPTRLERRNLARFRFVHRKNWELDCNWKVYVDNYLEGYHIPIVHPSLFRELDYNAYRTETKEQYSIQHAPIRRAERLVRTDDSSEAEYYWLFPNLMLNVYPDNFSTNLILPLGPERTLTVFDWYFAEEDAGRLKGELERTVSFSDEIQLEDVEICEAVQRGLRSRTYRSGRYSVQRENGVHHFHQLLSEHLGIAIR